MTEPVKTTEDLSTEPGVYPDLLPASLDIEEIEPYEHATEVDPWLGEGE